VYQVSKNLVKKQVNENEINAESGRYLQLGHRTAPGKTVPSLWSNSEFHSNFHGLIGRISLLTWVNFTVKELVLPPSYREFIFLTVKSIHSGRENRSFCG
jgi:hypothetical protein